MQLTLFFVALVVSCSQAFAAFPTEEELRGALKTGMTVNQVVALYGTPGGGTNDGSGYRTFIYLSPANMRTREVEGYAGFKAFFRNGQLVRWEPINTIPSYDPDLHAREHLMPFAWEWGLMLIAAFAYGTFKAFRFVGREQRGIITAYKEREIPTRNLPPDFRFINHETTVQEAIDTVGQPDRTTPRVIRGTAAGFRTIEIQPGLSGIITYDYEMPYRAEVILMPERPFEPGNRIRAVYYRPPRTDEE